MTLIDASPGPLRGGPDLPQERRLVTALPGPQSQRILARKAGLNFSTFAHTGLTLPVYAYGAGSGHFSGLYDNTEIFRHFMAAMGLSPRE